MRILQEDRLWSKLPSYELQELRFNYLNRYTEKVVNKQENSVMCLSVQQQEDDQHRILKEEQRKRSGKTDSHVLGRPGT